MLTKDLLRLTVRKGEVTPRWLSPTSESWLECAQQLIGTLAEHEGGSRGDLDSALAEITGNQRDFKARRGLAKLLLDRTEFGVASSLEPSEVRAAVFEAAAPHQPLTAETRATVLAQVAASFEATPADVEAALYADLERNHRVGPCKPITAEDLIHRYNVALAQGVLLRSPSLRIILNSPPQKRIRQLVRYLKFHRLTHEAERTGSSWRFVVDGPLSIVKQSTRYGVALANFLPALLLAEDWELEADYKATPKARTSKLSLSSSDELRSHYRDTGTWTAPEEVALRRRLADLADGWTVSEDVDLLDLGGRDVAVPDLSLVSPEGEVVYVEILWRWRSGALESRWKRLGRYGPDKLILAVSSAHASKLPSLDGPVHVFKSTPNARSIWKLARELTAG